jgi:hypothetical protein
MSVSKDKDLAKKLQNLSDNILLLEKNIKIKYKVEKI